MQSYFIGIFFIFVIIQRIYETYSLPKRHRGEIYHSWTLTLMTLLHILVVFGALAEWYLFCSSSELIIAISALGFSLYTVALVLRNWAKRTLANHWSLQIEIQKNHRVVREGPFKFIRHAAYLAIIMEVVGIPLVSNSFWTLIVGSLPYILLILWRIRIEEVALVDATGWQYIKYQVETGQLLPTKIGISCYDRRMENTPLSGIADRRLTERRTKKISSGIEQRKVVRKKI